MTLEKILKIASDNGFDWWGRIDDIRFSLRKFSARNSGIILYADGYNSCGYVDSKSYKKDTILIIRSLADIATNKSFLEALAKEEKYGKGISKDIIAKDLQWFLIKDITENNGKDFAKICSDFIGGNYG